MTRDKLLPEELYDQLAQQDPYGPYLNGQELPTAQQQVLAKYFLPGINLVWYAISASRDEQTKNVQFFGLVEGIEVEFGYFWLSELLEVKGPLGLGVERDLYWDVIPLTELKARYGL